MGIHYLTSVLSAFCSISGCSNNSNILRVRSLTFNGKLAITNSSTYAQLTYLVVRRVKVSHKQGEHHIKLINKTVQIQGVLLIIQDPTEDTPVSGKVSTNTFNNELYYKTYTVSVVQPEQIYDIFIRYMSDEVTRGTCCYHRH